MSSTEDIAFAAAVLYLVGYAAADVKTGPEMRQIFQDCKNEIGYTGNMATIQAVDPPTQEKCFVKCVYEKKGVLRSDGSIDVDLHKAYLSVLPKMRNNEELKAKSAIAIEECAAQLTPIPGDLCESAYQYFDCKRTKSGSP